MWTVWKASNRVVLKDEVFSMQWVKTSFFYLLWSETKLSIVGGLSTSVGFVDG